MRKEGSSSCGRLRLIAAPLLLSLALFPVSSARAQSAADKATARQAATQGIQAYNAGDFEKALDRMRRAQELYDAPVHLLYIARSHAKLGQLVEAAETYRLLVRYSLDAGAPQAFVQAKEDAKTELAALEPKVPSLEIRVMPEGVGDVDLQIDGKPVSAAVIGIARAINPGEHTIVVNAPGYEKAEQSVSLAEGETKDVTVSLEADPDAPTPAGTEAPAEGAPVEAASVEATTAEKPSLVGFMLGLRLGVTATSGKIGVSETYFDAPDEVAMSDLFGGGGGIELRGGVRIAKYFTPLLFVELHTLTPSDEIQTPDTVTYDNKANAASGGLGVMIGTPRNEWGGFGELGFALAHDFSLTSDQADSECSVTRTLSGAGVRLGGGANFPVGDFLHLTPFAMLTLGQFSKLKRELSGGCEEPVLTEEPAIEVDLSGSSKNTHSLFFLGVGGDFVFGADKTK